jgi:hypothetical protein
MNVKRMAIAALRAKRHGRVRPGWTREELSRIGPLTARMLKTRHISELVGQEVTFHFGGISMNGMILNAAEGE